MSLDRRGQMPLTVARPGLAVRGTRTTVRNEVRGAHQRRERTVTPSGGRRKRDAVDGTAAGQTAPRPDRRDGHHPARRRDAPSPAPVRRWFGNWCWRLAPVAAECPRPLTARRHRRTQWHRHYHHHLHMWTGSCCWWLLVLYAAVVVVASFARAAHSAKDVPVYHVRAVAGQQARLPCDISLVSDEDDDLSDPGVDSPPLDGESSLASGVNVRDAVLLVLWYRDDLGTPIYSVDARLSATHTHQEYDSTSSYHLMTTGAERWSDQRVFGDRAHFHVNGDEGELKSKTNNKKKSVITTYYSSELRIDRVGVKDAIHLYRCRVDFRLAQTRNSKVNLTVVVPPDRMEIVDVATGRQLLRRQDGDGDDDDRRSEASTTTTTTTVVGPYVEGSDVRVRCRVHGGKPRPRVAWFRDNRLLKPESDDGDDLNDARQQEVIANDAYATATVTMSSLTSTGGDSADEVIEVYLTLTGLTRSDLHTELTCRAWNYFYDDEEYSIVVTNSGTTSIDTNSGREDANGEVDPSRWTLRQRQSSLTAVVHVDMNFPPLTVQILPITGNGRYGGIDDDSHPSPFTQSSANMTPLPVPEGSEHLAVNGGSDVQEHRQIQSLTAGRKYELPCRAYGSRPPAKLTWWMDGRRLDTTHETTSSDGNSTTSVLTFVPVKPAKPRYLREPVGGGEADVYDGRLTCRAENPQHQQQSTNSRKHTAGGGGGDSSDDAGSPFIQSTWLLRIQYVPETQITLGTNLRADDIREGTDVYFDCTVDAVPPAYKVQWKRDGMELHHNVGGSSGSMSGSGPTTTIIISNQSLVLQGVSRREAGHYTCGAENAEGPGPHSKPIYLDVLYAPTCTPNNSANKSVQRVVYGVAKKETVTIACHVQANPAPTEYRWSFNNTISSIATGGGPGSVSTGSLIKQRFSGIGNLAGSSLNSSKVLTYAPRTDFDYGTVECWARNRVGIQTHPCVYHVIAAGRPDRVTNCTVVDSRSAASRNGTRKLRNSRNPGSHIFIRCTEGYDGGLPQRLWAEIREAPKVRQSDLDGDDLGGDLVLNVTGVDEQDRQGFTRSGQDDDRKSPTNAASPPVKVFVARGLKPGAVYRVDVMASNAKGRSEPLTLMISIPTGMAGTDADDKNGMSNIMNTMDVGQDPDRARNLLLEQQREQERGRRLKEDGDGGTDGHFRITRAMAVVMLVAGSLVVVACGAATFLRYSRDDNDDDDDDDDAAAAAGDDVDDNERRRNGGGDDGTAVGTGTMSRGPGTKTAAAAYEPSRPAGDGGRNGAGPKPPMTGDKTAGNEYRNGDGGRIAAAAAAAGGRTVQCDVAGGGPLDASGAPIVLVVPSSHVAGSPTSLMRGANPCNAYNTTLQPNKNSADYQSAGVRALPPCLSYHRNPDIIPAPLHMSPGTVYNNYNDPSDSMTTIMNSSTSSSPIHYNHNRQKTHQPNRYGNNASQYYNQGVMTLRRPPANGQYYNDIGGNSQRNVLQRPDPAVTIKDVPVDFPPPQTTSSASAAAYCTLPRSSYHHHRQHQLYYHQPVNLDAMMTVEPMPVIVVPSPPLPSPPPPPPPTDNKQPAALVVVNKRESAV